MADFTTLSTYERGGIQFPSRIQTDTFIDEIQIAQAMFPLRGFHLLLVRTWEQLDQQLEFKRKEPGALAFRKALGGMKL